MFTLEESYLENQLGCVVAVAIWEAKIAKVYFEFQMGVLTLNPL